MSAPTRTATTENFPVASWLLKPAARAPILAFYRFARQADDIADDASRTTEQKRLELDAMSRTLRHESDSDSASVGLREALRVHDPHHQPLRHPHIVVHALDLLAAFFRDVDSPRTATYADLLRYCRLSAMPVGRFVLDVHGEDRGVWPASDALCAALQIINHLQDCGKDFRDMDRVYIPDDMLAAAGLDASVLAADRSPPALLGVIRALAARCDALLATARPFAAMLRNRRLAAEVRVIQRLAEDLTMQLARRDPLAERIAHSKPRAAWLSLRAVLAT